MIDEEKTRKLLERAQLVIRWAEWAYENTDTFEGELGVSLAYLWPAILKGGHVGTSKEEALYQLLKDIPRDDPIWDYIVLEDE